ncbi:MAG TPA: ribonuclease H-like domain-containing protein [Dissulfurispiraceae bacterium]|nr:ribonuclease H-like domain-containing protein [Dissulfurispiraceae bacterium]
MGRVIFDIETVGADIDSLDPAVSEYLLKWAENEEEKERIRESLSFYPLTGEIVAIGMLNPDTDKGAVFFQALGEVPLPFEENGIRYECGTEKEVLEKFWSTVKAYDQVVTFNGRAFDCPFILVRSGVHKVKPTRELMPYRYGNSSHIDLFDQLSFYGAMKRKFPLDMWCRTFGIKSPKSEGITGYDVKNLFQAGRFEDIARYCAGDLVATKEVLSVWENYIRFSAP